MRDLCDFRPEHVVAFDQNRAIGSDRDIPADQWRTADELMRTPSGRQRLREKRHARALDPLPAFGMNVDR